MSEDITIGSEDITHLYTRTASKVCIVGFADGHRADAPFDEPDMEFWGLNRLHTVLPDKTWHRWFELHDLEKFYADDLDHQTFLKQADFPVYVRPQDLQTAEAWGIDATPYPRDQIVDMFQPYFTNTVSWLLAMAIVLEFEEIHLYGVDMAMDHVLHAEYCVSPDTRILVDGLEWKPADQIVEGDYVVGFDDTSRTDATYRQYRKSKVLGVSQLMRPSYRLEMSDGTKLVSSQEHRWLTNYGNQFQWMTTDELHPSTVTPEVAAAIIADYGDYTPYKYSKNGWNHRTLAEKYGINRSTIQRVIAGTYDFDTARTSNVVKLVEPWDTDRSWGAGFLSAAFDGEGHLTMRPRHSNQNGTAVVLGFAQRENAMAAVVESELSARRFEYGRSQSESDGCINYTVKGGRSEILRFLGTIRPPRLLDKFDADMLGIVHSTRNVDIVGKEYVGEQPVIAITTETGTFIAEGYASHNSAQRPSCEWLIGLAQGRGIKVVLPPGSDLMKASHLYGFDDDAYRAKMTARVQELANRKEQIRGEMQQHQGRADMLQARISELDGSMQECHYQLRNLVTQAVGDM